MHSILRITAVTTVLVTAGSTPLLAQTICDPITTCTIPITEDNTTNGVDIRSGNVTAAGSIVDMFNAPGASRTGDTVAISGGNLTAGGNRTAIRVRYRDIVLSGGTITASEGGGPINGAGVLHYDADRFEIGAGALVTLKGGDVSAPGPTETGGVALSLNTVDTVAFSPGSAAQLTGGDGWNGGEAIYAFGTVTGTFYEGSTVTAQAGDRIDATGNSTANSAVFLDRAGSWTVEAGAVLTAIGGDNNGVINANDGGRGLWARQTDLTLYDGVFTGGIGDYGGEGLYVAGAGTGPETNLVIASGTSDGSPTRPVFNGGTGRLKRNRNGGDGVLIGRHVAMTFAAGEANGGVGHGRGGSALVFDARGAATASEISGGTFTGGTFGDGSLKEGGSALTVESGELFITGGSFTGGHSDAAANNGIGEAGQAILMAPDLFGNADGTLTVRGGTFSAGGGANNVGALVTDESLLILEGGELSGNGSGYDLQLSDGGDAILAGGKLDRLYIDATSTLTADAVGDGFGTDPLIFDPSELTLTGTLDDGSDVTIDLFTNFDSDLNAPNTLDIGDELLGDIILAGQSWPPGRVPAPSAFVLFFAGAAVGRWLGVGAR